MKKEQEWKRYYLPKNTYLKEKYRVDRILGEGSFGIIYLCFDTLLNQKVAVKEFFPVHLAARSSNGVEVFTAQDQIDIFEEEKDRFKKEAETLFGNFHIPGICSVKDYFEENQTAYLAEEYLSGGTLKKYLEEKNNGMIS